MVRFVPTLFALLVANLISCSNGFAPSVMTPGTKTITIPTITSSTELYFGIPKFLEPKNDDTSSSEGGEKATTTTKNNNNNKDEALPKKDLTLSGIVQLITAGAGAPFLGDYEGVDEETGNFMFSLEANNLVDENGNSKQTQMPYFESGWVDPEDEKRAAEGAGFKWPWQQQK